MSWIRSKLNGKHDPVKAEVVNEIAREQNKLNGAIVELSQNVAAVKSTRQERNYINASLDDALDAVRRKENSR